MEDKSESTKLEFYLKKCGVKNRYQYISLVIIFFIYGTSEFLAISLPLLEITPFITYYDKDLKQNITIQTNYNLCNNTLKYVNFTIDFEKSKSSFVTDFNIFCNY